ncbi:MAG: AbrB/MazE/SpoVT family DNA-binding domain-containing protein [Rhodospirillaceae bacterium]|nr:AbrB/MazE/SpoVT family DNA-binding domain-containing protein [Rhodospirillaceae bacterium]
MSLTLVVQAMTRVKVGKWGKNLAIRVPYDLADASGLSDGEQVEIEMKDGDLVVRRPETQARARAKKAAQDIRRDGKKFSLGDVTIQDLRNEGRR